jgi:hypothetical protein
MMVSAEYRYLPTLDQFHLSVGYWFSIDIVSTMFVLSCSSYMFRDALRMTQFPDQLSIELMGLASALSIVRFSQWFGNHLPFYQLIVILREAGVRLAYLVISILPIVAGFSLWGILMFGFVDDSFMTFRYLVQRMVTSGCGDSIDDFYIVIDDRTDVVAWLSFVYVSMITMGGMWILFTSCIATVSYVHQTEIVSRDSYWKSSDSESGEEEDEDS